jgi:hypothetical protein
MSKIVFRCLIPLLLLAIVSACKKNDTENLPASASSSEELDACKLISKSEAAVVTGVALDQITTSASANYEDGDNSASTSSCVFSEPLDQKNRMVNRAVSIWVRRAGKTSSDSREAFEILKETAQIAGPPIKEIGGLGNGAFWNADNLLGQVQVKLYLLKGDVILVTDLSSFGNDPAAPQRLQNLVGQVVKRL